MALGSTEGAHARLQHPDALEHLDPRGLSRTLPAFPSSAEGRVQGPQVDALRAGVVRRRMGALLRADDDRGWLPPRRSNDQARTARGIVGPSGAVHRGDTPALRGSV